jgi:hypothetical protein
MCLSPSLSLSIYISISPSLSLFLFLSLYISVYPEGGKGEGFLRQGCLDNIYIYILPAIGAAYFLPKPLATRSFVAAGNGALALGA